MNYIEVKCFVSTDESRAYHKLNEDADFASHLYKIEPVTIDFDRIISFLPHMQEPNATILELVGSPDGFILPMTYGKFKAYFNNKMTQYVS